MVMGSFNKTAKTEWLLRLKKLDHTSKNCEHIKFKLDGAIGGRFHI